MKEFFECLGRFGDFILWNAHPSISLKHSGSEMMHQFSFALPQCRLCERIYIVMQPDDVAQCNHTHQQRNETNNARVHKKKCV